MKISPIETRYRTSRYGVTDSEGKEHFVSSTPIDDPDAPGGWYWYVRCWTCTDEGRDGKHCEHAKAVRDPLDAVKTL